MKGRIGLNIASILPWSAMPLVGLPLAARMTRQAGYSFWQVLPLRSVAVAGLQRAGIPVRFVEPAWNATTFRGHLRGDLGSEGLPTTWLDPLFFPGPPACQRIFSEIQSKLGATPIHHRAAAGGLLEVGPLMEAPLERLFDGGLGLVVDLRHLRRMGDLPRIPLAESSHLLLNLLPHTQLIHFQAWDAAEWGDFLAGRYTQLQALMEVIVDEGYNSPFVVEFDPRAFGSLGLSPWNLAKNLRLVRERVEEIL